MLVTGLGNPGQKYVHTRHNVGRDILVRIAEGADFSEWKTDRLAKALIADGFVSKGETSDEGRRVIIALPETFMNRSGEAVRELVKKYGLSSQDVIVVYDDIDLPFGTVRISKDRGDGGHNGVKSVSEHLGTKDFVRIRIGICPTNGEGEKAKPHKTEVGGYVLAHFSPAEEEALEEVTRRVERAVWLIALAGVERAMNTVNES